MRGWRAGLSLGVIAVLAVAVWAAVRSGGDEPETTTTTTGATTTLATPTSTAPPTTRPPTTTTTVATPTETTVDPEARAEEVRLILEDLYYRWFTAIYHNDEDAVREVVALQQGVDDFHRAVAAADWDRPPERSDVEVETEILRDDSECLAVYFALDLTAWLGPEGTVEGVKILFPHATGWRFATTWANQHDLWEQDCEIEPSEHLP